MAVFYLKLSLSPRCLLSSFLDLDVVPFRIIELLEVSSRVWGVGLFKPHFSPFLFFLPLIVQIPLSLSLIFFSSLTFSSLTGFIVLEFPIFPFPLSIVQTISQFVSLHNCHIREQPSGDRKDT